MPFIIAYQGDPAQHFRCAMSSYRNYYDLIPRKRYPIIKEYWDDDDDDECDGAFNGFGTTSTGQIFQAADPSWRNGLMGFSRLKMYMKHKVAELGTLGKVLIEKAI